jgi:hypothetical protein
MSRQISAVFLPVGKNRTRGRQIVDASSYRQENPSRDPPISMRIVEGVNAHDRSN